MFNFLPQRAQTIVLSIVLGLITVDVLNTIEDDIVFAINGDSRSTFLEWDNWGLWRYAFRLAVIAACAITLKRTHTTDSEPLV